MARSAAQIAASKRNLAKARAARKKSSSSSSSKFTMSQVIGGKKETYGMVFAPSKLDSKTQKEFDARNARNKRAKTRRHRKAGAAKAAATRAAKKK
jgi:hypothetical protein